MFSCVRKEKSLLEFQKKQNPPNTYKITILNTQIQER